MLSVLWAVLFTFLLLTLILFVCMFTAVTTRSDAACMRDKLDGGPSRRELQLSTFWMAPLVAGLLLIAIPLIPMIRVAIWLHVIPEKDAKWFRIKVHK